MLLIYVSKCVVFSFSTSMFLVLSLVIIRSMVLYGIIFACCLANFEISVYS